VFLRILWQVTFCLLPSVLAAAELPPHADTPQFEEPLELFVPRQAATEQEQDRAEALTYYGMAREAEGRGDNPQALRWFQRALRYDPACIPAARAAIRLAIRLQRPELGVDAALKIAECAEEDRLPLRYMALHLTRQGRWQDAVAMYERTLGIGPREPASDEDAVMMMEMARLCHLVEDNQKAAAYFAELLKALEAPRKHNLSPKTQRDLLGEEGATYQLIGSCFLAAGNVQAAEATFKKLEEASPDASRAAYNAAAIHRREGRLEEALAQLDLCFKNPGEKPGLDAYRLVEQTLAELGREGELIDYLASLHRELPDRAALRYFLAQKLFDRGQFDRAEQLYASLIDKSPTSTAYQRLLDICLSRSDHEKALAILAAVTEKTGTLDALGESLDQTVASPQAVEAIVSLAQDSSAAGSEAGGSRALAAGLIALAARRFDSAETLMAKAVAAFPDRAENLLLIWGLDLLGADRYEEAIRVFQQAVERDSMSDGQRAVFYYYQAAALELAGRTDDALEAARRAVKLNEDSPSLHVRVAWVLYHADRKAEAARAYRAVIDRFDADFDSDQARTAVRQARMVLSTLCVVEHRVDEAVEWLQQVLDESPDDSGALNDLGYLWADENQHIERAHRMIERAVAAEPENAAYRDSLGWVLYRMGRFQEAVAELAKAAEMEPDPVVLEHLGDAHAQTGQIDQAEATWEKAAAKFEEAGLGDKAAKVREKLSHRESRAGQTRNPTFTNMRTSPAQRP